jgi:GNAT superfamily N-acetyltransferase
MLHIRPAVVDDASLLLSMIRELAEFEHESENVRIQESDLVRDGFAGDPRFRALIAEWSNKPAGYAIFYNYYSTWTGRALYLEDLFVRASFRQRGIGMALLEEVARIAVNDNCHGIHWSVLDWNENAIALYKRLGATFRDQWRSVLLSDDALLRLARVHK